MEYRGESPMKRPYIVFLPLIVAGCLSASPQEAPAPIPNVERVSEPDVIANAVRSAPDLPYPLVPLRDDLGESLIQDASDKRNSVDESYEQGLVLRSMDAVKEVIELRAKDKTNIGRGDHAKPLGCYPAVFTVSPPDVVRPEDRVGIAKNENLGKSFDAVVRFSNSEPKDVSDFRSATTGIAIKVKLHSAKYAKEEFLFSRSGEQDFIAGGLETFVSSNIKDYAELFKLRIHPISNALRIMNGHPEAFAVFGVDPLLRWFRPTASAAPMVLEEPFWSQLPYAWGDSAVKFQFDRCHDFVRSDQSFSRFDSGYQATVLTQHLKSQDICYVMKIQARPRARSAEERDQLEKTFPLEDAKVFWPVPTGAPDRASAEFREVARVRIKQGSNAMPDGACEVSAFNPWNGLKAHQPLGSLNRARLAVYKKSELVRKEIYSAMQQERK
jgi:hypothetical protein